MFFEYQRPAKKSPEEAALQTLEFWTTVGKDGDADGDADEARQINVDCIARERTARFPACYESPYGSFVLCNLCKEVIPETDSQKTQIFWHCDICHDGEFDICLDCMRLTKQCFDYEHKLTAYINLKDEPIPYFGDMDMTGLASANDDNEQSLMPLQARADVFANLHWRLQEQSASLCDRCRKIGIFRVFLGRDPPSWDVSSTTDLASLSQIIDSPTCSFCKLILQGIRSQHSDLLDEDPASILVSCYHDRKSLIGDDDTTASLRRILQIKLTTP